MRNPTQQQSPPGIINKFLMEDPYKVGPTSYKWSYGAPIHSHLNV